MENLSNHLKDASNIAKWYRRKNKLSMEPDSTVVESWNSYFLFASFGISFIGAYSAVTLCEQFRVCNRFRTSIVSADVALFLMAIAIGGGAIWSMHFVGMGSLTLKNSNGDVIPVKYDVGLTILSLICAIICVYLGLLVSTHDRAYSKDRAEIFQMLIQDAKDQSMKSVRSKAYLVRSALLKGIGPLAIGGVVTGGGVCVMHYIGMEAMMPQNVDMSWNAGIVAASVCIAIVAATAAFWILFRLLSLYPEIELLRVASAVAMTVAVCGMHYTGMAAAKYTYKTNAKNDFDTGSTVTSATAVYIALASGIAFSWLMTMLTQSDLRRWHFRLSETIRKTDIIFDDMRNVNYACNEVFVGRYEYIKGVIYDRGYVASQIVPSYDSATNSYQRPARSAQLQMGLKPVEEKVDEVSEKFAA